MKQLSVVLSDDLKDWEVVSFGCHLNRTSVPQLIWTLFFSAGWHNMFLLMYSCTYYGSILWKFVINFAKLNKFILVVVNFYCTFNQNRCN